MNGANLHPRFAHAAYGVISPPAGADPSYGLLVAIGIAAADNTWSVPIAMLMTTCGSFCACLALYLLARAVGQNFSTRLLYRSGKLLGLSSIRIDQTLRSFRTRERTLIIISQLIPTVRLVAPLVAGLIDADLRRFVGGTLLGIALWNSLFIATGYFAASVVPEVNASTIAIKVLVLLMGVEALLALIWRFAGRSSSHGSRREERS